MELNRLGERTTKQEDRKLEAQSIGSKKTLTGSIARWYGKNFREEVKNEVAERKINVLLRYLTSC